MWKSPIKGKERQVLLRQRNLFHHICQMSFVSQKDKNRCFFAVNNSRTCKHWTDSRRITLTSYFLNLKHWYSYSAHFQRSQSGFCQFKKTRSFYLHQKRMIESGEKRQELSTKTQNTRIVNKWSSCPGSYTWLLRHLATESQQVPRILCSTASCSC